MIMRTACYAAATAMPRRHPIEAPGPFRAAGRLGAALLLVVTPTFARGQSIGRDTDRIDITGRQNLTLGSGARAYGMGGAFLARADDATAASWNPAGLSYLRLPELSLVGAVNSFDISRGFDSDTFRGHTIDFAAFTWPVAFGGVRGATQLSYQRAISFDGSRHVAVHNVTTGALEVQDDGHSSGGFDVFALGAGLRLTRSLRLGFTVNRWLDGYDQSLTRYILKDTRRPRRDFQLDFRTRGWSGNFGAMWSPVESLNVGLVYKTACRADVRLKKSRVDPWMSGVQVEEVTLNSGFEPDAGLDLPASSGVGLSWRPHDTFTISADLTLTRWSKARIYHYFDLTATAPDNDPLPPNTYPQLQYPSLLAVPTPNDPSDPLALASQRDKQELRVGAEYVLIKGQFKVPLRAGYFNDRQISADSNGSAPHFDGFTAGAGIVLGSVLLDVAYVYEFGSYYVSAGTSNGDELDGTVSPPTPATQRNALTTHRLFASVIYRFNRH
jgi:hypothetical protein